MDKFIRTILAIVGESLEIIVTVIKYVLGLIWVIYSFIRRKNYKKRFRNLNNYFVTELKASLNFMFKRAK